MSENTHVNPIVPANSSLGLTTFGKLRAYFLAGLVVAAPIAITLWVTWWFISLIDGWIKPVLPSAYNPDHYLPFSVPGVGLVAALAAITLIGFLATNLLGRSLLHLWETLLGRMPFVRSIYKGTKQIFQTLLSQGSTSFRSVGLIEFPRSGCYAIVFLSREVDGSLLNLEPGEAYVAACMAPTPNPTSAFLYFIKKSEVMILDITVEDGLKLLLSGGLIYPDRLPRPGMVPVPVLSKEMVETLTDKTLKPIKRRRTKASPAS